MTCLSFSRSTVKYLSILLTIDSATASETIPVDTYSNINKPHNNKICLHWAIFSGLTDSNNY